MPDPVVLKAHLDTGPTVPRIDEAVRKMRELGSATDDAVKRFHQFFNLPGGGSGGSGGGGRGGGGGPGRPAEDARKKLERLTKQTQLATRIAREHGTSVQAASRAVRAFGKDVSRAEAEASKYAVSLDRAQKEAKALAAEQRKANKAGGMFSGIAGGMAKGLLAVGAAALTAQAGLAAVRTSVATYAELEDQLLGTQAVTMASAAEMARLTDQAKALGAATPRTAVEIAGLQQELARAGFTIQETLDSTGGLIAFASAGQLELAEATGFAATILRAFDKDVSQLSNVTDILAVSASGAKTDIAQLASAFEFAAAPAAAIGASLEETSAAIAVVQERGVQGSKAGRGLLGIFRELSVETERGAAVLEKAGLAYEDVNIAAHGLLPVIETLADKVGDDFVSAVQLVGSEAAPAFINLIRGVEKFGDLTDQNMTKAAGRTQEMADVMESGLGGASRRLNSAAEGVMVAFGEGIAPALQESADAIADMLSKSQDFLGFLGSVAGAAAGVASSMAEFAFETLQVVGLSKLVRDLEDDIQGLVGPSAAAREEWEEMSATIASGSREQISQAADDARASLIAMGTEIDEITGTLQSTETQAARTNKALGFDQAGLSEEQIKELKNRIGELNAEMAGAEMRATLYENALDGLSTAVDDQAKADKIAAERAAKRAKIMERGVEVSREFRTQHEKNAEALKEVRTLFDQGAVSAETLRRAMEKLADDESLLEFRRQALDASGILEQLGQAPGQLKEVKFDPFAALGPRDEKPKDRFDPTPVLERAAELTRSMRMEDEIRLSLASEALGLFNLGLISQETMGRVLAQNNLKHAETKEELEAQILAQAKLEKTWSDVAGIALSVADAIGGAWGDMIGGLVDNVLGIRDAFKAVRAAKESGNRVQGAMAGAQMGGMIGGISQSFGLFEGQRGTSQFGGQLSGDFGDIGSVVGGAIGGVFGPVGAVVGSVLGGIIGGAIKSGADEGLAQLRQVGDEVEVKITKDEGGLGDVVSQIGNSIAEAVEGIESMIGGQITLGGLGQIPGGEGISGEGVNLAIKIRDEAIAVFVNGLRREFETIEEAVQFGTLELLKGATLSGVSENVAAALKNTVAATFEELAADIQAAQMVDVRLMTEGEKFLMERTRLINDEQRALSGLGVSMQDWIDGLLKAEDALARQAEQQALSLAGVDFGLEQSLKQLSAIEEQAAQTEALNAVYAAQAENATNLAAQERERAQQAAENASQLQLLQIESGRFGAGLERLGIVFDDLQQPVQEVGEAAVVTARDIEGIDRALVELSREAVVARGLGSFVSKIAEFTGNAELAAAAQELLFKAELITLQLEFARIDALGLLDDALRASIATVLEQAELIGPAIAGGPARRGGGGGRGRRDDRASRRADIREEFRDLAMEASETRDGVRGLQVSLRDFRETMREASELGKIGADVMSQAWENFIVVAARAATDGVQGSLDLFRGVSNLGGALASSAAEFDDARGQIWLLIQAAEEQELATGALVDAHRELVAAEQLAADVLVAQGLADELAAVGVALDPDEIRKLAEFEFELARVRAINAILAAEEAGALERLGLDMSSLLERIAGAELPEIGDEDPAVRHRFDNLDDLMASLADGVEASIMRIADETATLLENATTLGAGIEQLAMIQGKGIEALLALGESATSAVQAELDAAAGLDSFRTKLRQTDEKFADTAETLRLVIAATRAAGGDVSDLVRDLNRLETAARVADREVARGLIDSFSQLGVALPIELTQALAAAEFEEARAKALATIATLDARGAFDALGVSAEELTARLIGATFGADGADATGAARSGGFSRGGSGARQAGEDLSRLRQEVLDTIQAWTQEGLGDATRQALGFAQALVDTRAKAERAGVALELVDGAFDDLRRTFVDRQLADFEGGLSDVDRELSGINDRFTDIMASFMVIGAEAEDFARAGEAFAASVAEVENQLKAGIREQLAEIRGEDPTVTSRQIFEEAQARFRDLAARAQLGDLEAVRELGPAAADFRAQIASFLGGRGVVGVEALVGEIRGALEAVDEEDLIPRDIAALEDAAASLASIDITTQAQPTAAETSSGFSSISGAVSELDFSEITALISEDDLQTLIDGLGAPEFSELITAIGALPISQLVDALGAQGLVDLTNALSSQTLTDLAGALGADVLADLTVEFGPTALADLANTIGGLDIDLTAPDLDFGSIVNALGGIGTPLGDLVAAIGPEGFQAFVNALTPIATNTAAGAAGSEAVAQALTLESENKILGKLAAIRVATEGSEAGLRGQVWVKTWLSRQLDAAKDLNQHMNVPGYLTGGMVPSTGLAMLHAGERVLNPSQTRRFEDLGGLQMLDIPPVVIPPMPMPAEQSSPRGGDDPVVAQLAALRREEGQRHQRETEMTGRQAASSSRQGQSLHEIAAEIARLQAALLREVQRQAGRSGGVPGGVR
jgi:TP901 family phage tail tape measure protein